MLLGLSPKMKLYAIQAYSSAFISSPAGFDYIKDNLEITAKMYELISYKDLSITVLDIMTAVLEEIPKFIAYIMKTAKRISITKSRAIYSELLDSFKLDEVEIKIRVMNFINSMLKLLPNDKQVCRFISQLENLNLYEYLQEASKRQCAELNQTITTFQKLGKIVIRTTQFENEALRNRIKNLELNCKKLEEKLMMFAEQQSLFEYLKDDFRCLEALAKMSVERGTLYTPCISLVYCSYSYESKQSRKIEIFTRTRNLYIYY